MFSMNMLTIKDPMINLCGIHFLSLAHSLIRIPILYPLCVALTIASNHGIQDACLSRQKKTYAYNLQITKQ